MNTISKWLMALALLSGPVVANAQTYSVTQIGGPGTLGFSVNESGQVAGFTIGASGSGTQAFVTGANGIGFTYLGSPDVFSEATGINASGQVVVVTNSGLWSGYVTGPNGVGMNPLPVLPSANEVYPLAINDSGQITGWSGTVLVQNAFITGPNGAGISNLGTLGGVVSVGNAINASGKVTGSSTVSGESNSQAFITGPNGVGMSMVTTLGGDSAYGQGINASGQITGYSNLTAQGSIHHAFLTGSSGVGVTDLGVLPGYDNSIGRAINDLGQVTGDSYPSSGANGNAFLYSNGKMQNLNSLINPSSALAPYVTLFSGFAINNNGQIVAEGVDSRYPGFGEAYLLTPVLTLACPAATAQVTVPYSSALTAAGGIPPYTFSISTGSLPPVLSLNTSTGAVTGTPTTAGAFSFTAKVVDSSGLAAGTITSNCAITVSPTPVSQELSALLQEVTGVGPGKSLAAKVMAAQADYAASDTQATCAMLTAFVHEVQAQDGKKIGQQLDPQLIADAEAIDAAIGCN